MVTNGTVNGNAVNGKAKAEESSSEEESEDRKPAPKVKNLPIVFIHRCRKSEKYFLSLIFFRTLVLFYNKQKLM